MAEWLYEAGIGEARAALVDGGAILAARIELDGALRPGTVAEARLIDRDGRVALATGQEALLDAVPSGLSVGRALMISITRAAIPEPGRNKRARAVSAPADAVPVAGPDLLTRITATGQPVRHCHPHAPDDLEAAGWSEVLAEASDGEIAFPGGALRMIPTPAMTLFDVDGSGRLDGLAVAAATAVGEAIVRHDIGGSIGVDFPSVTGRDLRQAVASALDAALVARQAGPFERTALNGFGFLQIVRPRPRASLPEILRADPVAAAARAALRQMERTPPGAPRVATVPAPVRDWLAARPDLMAMLAARVGSTFALER